MRLSFVSFVVALSLSSVAAADDAILIMDASRSMLSRVQGKRKVDIARDVVGHLLGDIPKDRRLGFVAYGHRHAEDCNDIEEVVPVGDDRAPIKSWLDTFEVKGQTPLTAAVQFAADKLAYTKNKATVILVSDGIESCHADPCAVGAALEKAGIDLTVHVVGFGLKKSEIKGLKCLAEATGGKYLSANNANELTRALEQTVAKKVEQVEGAATLAGPGRVLEGRDFEVGFTGPNDESDRIALARSTDKPTDWLTAIGPRSAEDGKVSLLAPAQPGIFELRYVSASGHVLAKAPIEIAAVEATVSGPLSVGAGAEFEVRWKGPPGDHDYVRLCKPEQKATEWVTQTITHDKNGGYTLTAPSTAGKYELRYTVLGDRVVVRAPIAVVDVTAKVTAPTRVAAGATFEVKWTGPSNEVDKVYLASPGGPPSDWKAWLAPHDKDGVGELWAPRTPGKYEVRYVLSGERILDRVSVEVTDVTATVRGPASVAAGTKFEVAWTGPNYAADKIKIARPGTDVQAWERWQDARGTDHTISAPDEPGTYELRYVLGDERILAKQTLLVR